jgi:plastocyanin
MGKQTFGKIKKTVTILLAIFFIAILTATSVTAAPHERSKSAAGGGRMVDVYIQNNAFNPASVQISTGDTVRWTNMDSVDHAVFGSTLRSGVISGEIRPGPSYGKEPPKEESEFGYGVIRPGNSYGLRFTVPGVYNYYCSIHPDEKGTVTVV